MSSCSTPTAAVEHWKAAGLDLAPILHAPEVEGAARTHPRPGPRPGQGARQHPGRSWPKARSTTRTPVRLELPIRNVNRTVGTMLGHEVTKRYADAGLPDDTIDVTFTGSAGQSFGAFVPKGITLRLLGDANDYLGKGLSGGRIVVRPNAAAPFRAEDNVIAGNVILYGATGGEVFIRGDRGGAVLRPQLRRDRRRRGRRRPRLRVHDRWPGRRARRDRAQRRGRHVRRDRVLPRSRSGRVNREMVDLEPLDDDDREFLREADRPARGRDRLGGRGGAARRLGARRSARFAKVMPRDYKRVLEAAKAARDAGRGRRRGDHGGVPWLTRRAS